MKKDYQKPEVELISLAATEAVTDNEVGDGGMDTASNNMFNP